MSYNWLSGKGIAALTLAAALIAPGIAQAAAKPIVLNLAHSATPDNSLSHAYEFFAQKVKEKTGGSVEIKIHGNGVLAADQTVIEGAKMGTVDMGSCSTSNMGSYTSAYLFLDLPFIFKDMEATHKVLWGPIGDEMKEKASKDIGSKVLFYVDCGGGFRLVVNNKHEIRTPADMKGLKFRVTGSPIERAWVEALGASGTPVPFIEVYTALEQKVVDGENLFPMWVYLNKHYEALKYMTAISGMTNPHVCVISNFAWMRLSPEQQQAIIEAGKETQDYAAIEDAEVCKDMTDKLVAAGLKLYVPTPAEVEEWRKVSMSIYPKFYDKIPEEFIARVLKAQE